MVAFALLLLFPSVLAIDVSYADSTVSSDAPVTSASELLFESLFETDTSPEDETLSEHAQDKPRFWMDYFRDTDGDIKPRKPNSYPRVLSCPEFLLAVLEDVARENPGVEEIYDLVRNRINNMSEFFKELLLEIFRSNASSGLSTSSSSETEDLYSTSSPEVEDLNPTVRQETIYSISSESDDVYTETSSTDEDVYSTVITEDDAYTASSSEDGVFSTIIPVNEADLLTYAVVGSEDSNVRVLESNLIDRSGRIVELMEDSEEDCDDCPLRVGSIRGVPGVHFPKYEEIPITSFSCVDKHTPGFYADLETGCQVFHVCWPHRRESFLCPVGTTFNQAILACDYWYSSNCSLAPHFFEVNPFQPEDSSTESMIDSILSSTESSSQSGIESSTSSDVPALSHVEWIKVIKFLPIKVKIIECPSQSSTDAPTSSKATESTHNEELATPVTVTKTKTLLKSKAHKDITSTLLRDILAVVEGLTRDTTKFVQQISEKNANRRRPSLKSETFRKPVSKLHSKYVVKAVPQSSSEPPKHVKTNANLKDSEKSSLRVSESVLQSIAAASSVLGKNISPLTRHTIIKNFSARSKH